MDFVPRPNVVPALDQWTCCEIMVQCNTPDTANGRVALWIDGELVADHPGLRFRSVEYIKAGYVSLSTYASQEQSGRSLWYDDIVVATEYVGPMGTGAAVAPSSGRASARTTGGGAVSHSLLGRKVRPSGLVAPGVYVRPNARAALTGGPDWFVSVNYSW
jgi:hypothetical protein